MAKHEFGIMEQRPESGKAYNEYTPERYRCVSVHDDLIEPLLDEFQALPCYWHSVNRPEMGLAYCGISLIPPESLPLFRTIIRDRPGFSKLERLLTEAEEKQTFIIHFGI